MQFIVVSAICHGIYKVSRSRPLLRCCLLDEEFMRNDKLAMQTTRSSNVVA
jgi:hypothetical protein